MDAITILNTTVDAVVAYVEKLKADVTAADQTPAIEAATAKLAAVLPPAPNTAAVVAPVTAEAQNG